MQGLAHEAATSPTLMLPRSRAPIRREFKEGSQRSFGRPYSFPPELIPSGSGIQRVPCHTDIQMHHADVRRQGSERMHVFHEESGSSRSFVDMPKPRKHWHAIMIPAFLPSAPAQL